MDLDEEAKRLAAAHPWAGTGATETHRTHWQPQHAVPRRPTVAKPLDADIEARVAADIAAIDREVDPHEPDPHGWGIADAVAHGAHPYAVNWYMPRGKELFRVSLNPFHMDLDGARRAMRRLSIKVTTDARGDVIYTPTPPKQRKPKTYVAPGRKAGRTWIARLEQSKQARKR